MAIDNAIYDRIAASWWDDSTHLAFLRTAINPVRSAYFRDVLVTKLGLEPARLRLLDVGCGGGFLAEEFARMGCAVTGVDPSAPTIEAAAAHARDRGLDIDYRLGSGEHLPVGDAQLDVVSCCDVLEHVSDLEAVIAEIARVLRPGGVFLYDTVNRTLKSKVTVIKLAQDWRLTRSVPKNFHVWRMFIPPAELAAALARHALGSREVKGLSPGSNPLVVLRAVLAVKRGRMSFAELGRRVDLRVTDDLSISYMGYATKDAPGVA
jgi:2-polyprenyl-6-hydroxyphenyl methylase/3-demethylubiquinone-9 3-methyltransferase